MKTIKNFKTTQDVVIFGGHMENKKEDFSITDDECGFRVTVGGKKSLNASSDGFVNIIAVPTFLKVIEKYGDDFWDWNITDAIFLQNFIGDINVDAVGGNGKSLKFNLDDYICHQCDDADVVIDLPIGSMPIKITKKNLTSILRDIKIDTIVN